MVDREPAALYEGLGMRITDWPQDPEGHFLYFVKDPEVGYPLMRGALKELGREESPGRFRSRVDQFNPEIMHLSRSYGISSEQIQFAFNQARINELENMLGEAVRRLADNEASNTEREDAKSDDQ